MSQISLPHRNAALPISDPFENLKTPATDRALTGEGKITIGRITSKIGYMVRALAEDITEVAITIGEGVGSAVRALVHRPALAVAGASIGLATIPKVQNKGYAAVMLDGTTREAMTAVNPNLEGFYASASTSLSGIGQGPFNSTLAHLWGPYYAAAAHEVENGFSLGSIYRGRNYVSNPGDPIGILSVSISPYSDLAIITADTADYSPRDPNSRIVGIAVAVTSNSTIYDNLSAPENLAFINQITGSNITIEQILAGQSIIAAPFTGQHIFSEGYGYWGTPATGLSNPDGNPGQWQGMYMPNGGGLNGTFNNSSLYFGTSFSNDGGLSNGALNGAGASVDSGAIGIVVVPEPASATLLLTGITGILAHRRRKSA